MSVFANLKALLSLDRSNWTSEVNKTKSDAQGLKGFVQSTLSGVAIGGGFAAGLTALQTGFQAVGAAAGFLKQSVFGMNSTLETSTLQFTTLMGNADKAREHVRGLFTFAKDTPFETGPVIQASRMLETFGGAALNTKANLTLIGDAAAATSAPIEELGFWVGRLYSGLKGGQPVGEATMRLQELAVLSPEARVQIEALTKAGVGLDETWKVVTQDLLRFNGAMALQASTWTGLVSTFTDSVSILASGMFKPLFDKAKEWVGVLNTVIGSDAAANWAMGVADGLKRGLQSLEDTVIGWVEAFLTMDAETALAVGRIAGYLSGLSDLLITWGGGIVSVLAQGILGAISVIESAVLEIGAAIGYWLEPHSPPKAMPWLADYGKRAGAVYVESFFVGMGGFGAGAKDQLQAWKDELASVQGQLGNGPRDFTNLNTSQRVARLRAELGRNDLSEADRNRLELQLRELQLQERITRTEAERRVKAKQEERERENALKKLTEGLDKVGKAIKEGLSPLEQALKGFQLQQAELRDLIRLKQLQAILDDEEATAAQKTAAMLEMQAIAVQRKIRAEEGAKLDITKELEALANVPIVLEDIEGKTGKAAKGIEGIGSALGNLPSAGNLLPLGEGESLQERLAALKDEAADFFVTWNKGFQEGRTAFSNFSEYLFGRKTTSSGGGFGAVDGEFFDEPGTAGVLTPFIDNLKTARDEFQKFVDVVSGKSAPDANSGFLGGVAERLKGVSDWWDDFNKRLDAFEEWDREQSGRFLDWVNTNLVAPFMEADRATAVWGKGLLDQLHALDRESVVWGENFLKNSQAWSDSTREWFHEETEKFQDFISGSFETWGRTVTTQTSNVFYAMAESLRRTFNTIIGYINQLISSANAMGANIGQIPLIEGSAETGKSSGGGSVPKIATGGPAALGTVPALAQGGAGAEGGVSFGAGSIVVYIQGNADANAVRKGVRDGVNEALTKRGVTRT